MKILITQRANNKDKTRRFDSLEQNYIIFFKSFGVTLIPIPNCLPDPEKYFKKTGATHLILSGGGDIHPKLYKGKIIPDTEYSKDRDFTEKKLLDYAISKKIPVLGICRGCQFINVYFGGGLIQDLNKTLPKSLSHVSSLHKVKLDNKISEKISVQKSIFVNSYHKSGITQNELAINLKHLAESPDGTIEGLYHEKLPIIGIMWHPERKMQAGKFNEKLINLFLSKKIL